MKDWIRANLEANEDDGTPILDSVKNDKSL